MEETLPPVPLDAIADGPKPVLSVADTLRAQYDQAKQRTTVDVRIPGYDALWGTFRAIRDFSELYDALDPAAKQHLEQKQLTLEIALDLITESSVGTFAVIDGERKDLGVPLGIALYDQLFPPTGDERPDQRPSSDRQAVIMLFPLGTASIVTLAQQLQLWQSGKMHEVDGDLVGN